MATQNLVLTHTDGAGDLSFSPDGTLMVTTGQDSRICVHETARALANPTDEHVVASFECAQPVTALHVFSKGGKTEGGKAAVSAVSALAASEDRMVSVYSIRDADSYLDVEPTETLARLSVPALSVSVASDTGACAFSGEDASIHVVAAPGAEMESIKGCRPDVVGPMLDPAGEYVVSASTAGRIRMFKCATGGGRSRLLLELHRCHHERSGAAVTRWRPSWSPKGRFLALVGSESIKIIKRGTWSLAAILSDTHTSPVMLTSFSPNGYYLASADTSGVVAVWSSIIESASKHSHSMRVSSPSTSVQPETFWACSRSTESMRCWATSFHLTCPQPPTLS